MLREKGGKTFTDISQVYCLEYCMPQRTEKQSRRRVGEILVDDTYG
jgi:hypothetical protein